MNVARGVAQVISFFGWLSFAATIFVAVLAVVGSDQRTDSLTGLVLLSMLVGGVVSSAILVATGQITRAIVDIADFNGEMLAILKTGIGKLRSTDSRPEPEF